MNLRSMRRKIASTCGLAAAIAALAGCALPSASPARTGLARIEHIVVIYAENRSFDNLYGLFPGANGIANATPAQYTQVDNDGKPFAMLPPVWKGKNPDPAFPRDLPNRPFRIDAPPVNLPLSTPTRDLVHKFYQNQNQIDGGRNDRFVAAGDSGALPMGYYDGSKLPMWRWAQEYTLADNFFMGAFGDSFLLNHQWLICACTPIDRDAPADLRAQLDERGRLKTKPGSPTSALQGPPDFVANQVSPDGYVLTTTQPPWQPSRVAPANYAPGTAARAEHLKDYSELADGIAHGNLPHVVFYKPQGSLNEHPGYADVLSGDEHIADVVAKIKASPLWATTAIIVTYDENGGFWDHVAPPAGDRWGPGTRIPTLIISPYARRGFVDHTRYDTTSIIQFITRRFGLEPLPGVRAQMGDLTAAFDFSQ